MVAIAISGFVSLSLTPMLCSRFLKPPHAQRHGWFYNATERVLDAWLRLYDRTLRVTLRFRLAMLPDKEDTATLVRIASEAGLDRSEAEIAVADEALRTAVADEEEKARAMGIQGVPFFIFNGRLAVEGAQGPDVLLEAMLEAEKESAAA